MKPQVYKDPRPAEHVPALPRMDPHPPARLDVRAGADGPDPDRDPALSRAGDRHAERARGRPVHPRAEPLLADGPLLRRASTSAGRSSSWRSRSCTATRCSTTSSASAACSPFAVAITTRRRSRPRTRCSARGGCVGMYCEGGRSRTGRLGEPKPGVGRLALESGVPVVPVAIHGSLGVRGWKRLRFPKVTIQYGEPISFPRVAAPASAAARRRGDDLRAGEGDVRRARGRGPRRRSRPARHS